MTELDPRLNAYREDLADIRLEGQVQARRFVAGEAGSIAVPVAPIRRRPDRAAGVESELLFGEDVRIFERADGWAWLQSRFDGYTGYVEQAMLSTGTPRISHVVNVPRTFVYPEPELKRPHRMALSLGSRLSVDGLHENRGTPYAKLATGGYVFAGHLTAANACREDYVAVAESLVATPYLWGGTSAFGVDCSGLVQLAMRMAGRMVLRDSDMQERSIGVALPAESSLRRGDLVFWKGHVAIFTDTESILHANGFTMQVSRESFVEALGRIRGAYGEPTVFRRP